jgi:thiamine kinase-like enzyme
MQLPNSLDDVRKILSQVDGKVDFDTSSLQSFQYLPDGITNDNYKLILSDRALALRINNPKSMTIGIDRDRELLIHQLLIDLELAPNIVFSDEKHQFRICEWLEGTVWTKATFQNKLTIRSLVKLIKTIHQQPTDNIPSIDLASKLRLYQKQIHNTYEGITLLEPEVTEQAIALLEVLEPQLPACLCHNDLLAANIITTKEQTFIIDYEYAGLNSPLFELAVFAQGNQFSSQQKQYLLECYFDKPTDEHKETFAAWCWFYDYLELIWGLAIEGNPTTYPAHLETHLIKFKKNMPNYLLK